MPYRPAPFLRRLGARLIDLLVALAVTFVLVIPVGLVGFLLRPVLEPVLGRSGLIGLLVAVCYFLAYVGLEVFLLVRRDGQTLGKGLLGLQVVRAGDTSARLTLGAAIGRMLLIFTPFVLMSLAGGRPDVGWLNTLAGIGLLSLLASLALTGFGGAHRRTVHDLLAGTRVVTAAKRKISLRHDLPMMIPGPVDMTKRL